MSARYSSPASSAPTSPCFIAGDAIGLTYHRLMKRLAPLLLILGLTACAPSVDSQATGEDIYLQLCARCHAEDLSGGIGPSLASGTPAANSPDAFMVTAVTRGRGRMPSFGRTLDDGQVERLIAHIRELQASG